MRPTILIISFALSSLLAPSLALAAPTTFAGLVNFFLGYINILIPMIISAAIVIYMKNTATGLYNLKSGKPSPDWQQSMFWGIVVITVMVSIWGILSVLGNTLRL